MKRKYIYGSVVALALLATSCEKVEPTLDSEGALSEGGTYSITIGAPTQAEGSRADMNDLNTEWSVGDNMTFFAYGASVANLYTGSGVGQFTAASVAADGSATFTGTSSSLSGNKVCGFYPGEKAYMNNTNTGVRFLSTLRLAQPTYFKLEYDGGVVTPSSMGQYAYLYFISDQTLSSATSSSNLTGTYKHIMGYLDFNFTGVSGDVERVYVASTQPVMEECKVDTDGNVTCDKSLDYAITDGGDDADATLTKLSKFQIEDFVFTLTDKSTGELGVAPVDGALRVRLPIFPQTLSGSLDIYVVYTNGTESVVTLNVNGVTVESGKRYFNDQIIPLSSTQPTNSKIGDYFWNDGTYKFQLDGSEASAPDGIAYDWAGSGASRRAGRVFSPTYYRGATYIGTDYINDSTNDKNTLLINQSDLNGICAMQTLMDIAIEPSQANGGNIFSQYSGTEELASTYSAHINSLIPAMGLVYDKSTDATYTGAVYSKGYTGSETYLWYVPTVYELYELYARVNAVQALDENFYVAQQIAIYDEGLYGVTKSSTVDWGKGKLAVPSSTASSVAITDNTTVGPFFDSIIPAYGTATYTGSSISAHNVNMRTATMRSDQPGAGYYVNLGNIYELIAITTANYYYGYSGYWNNNVGNTNPTWSIMCVDAAGATPNN